MSIWVGQRVVVQGETGTVLRTFWAEYTDEEDTERIAPALWVKMDDGREISCFTSDANLVCLDGEDA